MATFIDPQKLDPSVRPQDDFFGYVNNTWIKENPIPAEEAKWGTFYVLRVEVENQSRAILEELAGKNGGDLGEEARKVRDFYRTGMDVARLAELKDAPLAPLFAMVDAMRTKEEVARVLGFLHPRGVSAFWAVGADADAKKSDMNALYVAQSGLGLPDRDYYLNDDEASAAIRGKYLEYAEGMLGASAGARGAGGSAMPKIIEMETALARASMTRVELRDIEKQYNKMTPEEIAKLTPNVDWPAYFEAAGAAAPEYYIVCQPEFLKEVDREIGTLALDDIKAYLRWHIVNSLADCLDEDFAKRGFDFYGRTFAGATQMKPQWRRVFGAVNGLLDEAFGKLYVERHFGGEAKAKIAKLVEHLTAAYRTRIEKLDWMSDETKKKAQVKLEAVARKLGYPDKWKDIGAMKIGPDSYAENYMEAHRFEFNRQLAKVGKPVDRMEWYMAPQVVNACYNQLQNEILFPAAILQPPFFDPDADDAANFGGIGTVIGHELTHGFDDQGAMFDEKGNLADWWTADDKKRFGKQTAHLADQYDQYEPLPGLHVNGKLTLGENIADLGGILIAYDGLMLALKEKPAEPVDGLSPLARFFMNYAITERGHMRDEALRLQVQTDPHSPSRYRVNGPFSNMAEFYDVFDCKEGDALWRDPLDRVSIW